MATANLVSPPPQAATRRKPDILDRTFRFAVSVVQFVGQLNRTGVAQLFARQLVRSGTSVGANVEEAQGATTKKEFTRRMNIARAEARETLYWLRLSIASNLVTNDQVGTLVTEANELVCILTAIVKRSGAK